MSYGIEVDPNEEIRRKQEVYGYPGAAPPEPPASTSPYGVDTPAVSGRGMARADTYGTVPQAALVEHQEEPRQGIIDGPEVDTNPYGYPEDLPAFDEPRKPKMGWGGYIRPRGLATQLISGSAQGKYDAELTEYEQKIAARKREEYEHQRQYTAAERRENRARMKKQDEAQERNWNEDNLRAQANAGETARHNKEMEERQAAVAEAQIENYYEDNERAEETAANVQRNRERTARRLENPPARTTGGGGKKSAGKKFYPKLWADAQKAASTKDEYDEDVPGSPEEVASAYDRLLAAAGLDDDEGGEGNTQDVGIPMDPKIAKQFEGKRKKVRGYGWGTVRGGKFYPERRGN